jgi:8-oxo-dGTP pyrophosphatase MutT (NUDIX family)
VAGRVEEARPARAEGTSLIRAAGGVVVREADGDVEVLLVHRPRYDDWTFPKGKARPGEADDACALREVEEETGLRCELGDELVQTIYLDGAGRSKRVRYWRMRPVGGELAFRNEVDKALWVSPEQARRVLSYERDLPVLRGL